MTTTSTTSTLDDSSPIPSMEQPAAPPVQTGTLFGFLTYPEISATGNMATKDFVGMYIIERERRERACLLGIKKIFSIKIC